ncbi:DUF362 domain-containing protein, partial [Candidatus Fermentibacterales bacterium]|nr:DUF362 domain-containing protein [Candidatus Fermentibacterales bacterium]
ITFSVPEICTRMPVVSIPVVKTNHRSTISCALMNLLGCLDERRRSDHHRLADLLSRVNEEIPVVFTIADGTVSLDGSGPRPGAPIHTDFVALSQDRVAMDASLAGLMGFDPLAIETVVRANGRVGTMENLCEIPLYPLRSVPSFRLRAPEPDFLARMEDRLMDRRRRKTHPGDGLIMRAMKRGGRLWYCLAHYLTGQNRQASKWIRDSVYGAQWLGKPEQPSGGGERR